MYTFLTSYLLSIMMKTLRATWQWTNISSLELICNTKMLWNISCTPRNKKEKTLPIRSLLSYRLFSILWGFVLRFIMMTIFLPTANIYQYKKYWELVQAPTLFDSYVYFLCNLIRLLFTWNSFFSIDNRKFVIIIIHLISLLGSSSYLLLNKIIFFHISGTVYHNHPSPLGRNT